MTFGDLFLIIIAGLFGPLVAGNRFLALPVVAGEIIAGIIIGNSGLHLVNVNNETLQFLANFGFAVLLFVVGTRVPVANLFSGVSGTARRGMFAAIWALVLSAPAGWALAHFAGIGHPVMFGLLCAASSTSTVLPILAERKTVGDQATALTVWIPIADMATMILLPLAFGIGSSLQIMIGAGIVAVVGVVAFYGLRLFKDSAIGKRYRKLSKERFWALDLRLMLGVLVGLAALATKFGTSVLVAGFVAGLVSSLLGQPKRMKRQTTGVAEGFLVPLFFVFIGARIDLHALFTSPNNLMLCGMIVVAGLVVHLIAAKLARLKFSTGLIASQHMGLPAAIVSMGLAEHVINEGQAAAVITAALISLAVCLVGITRLPRALPENKPDKSDNTEAGRECDCSKAGIGDLSPEETPDPKSSDGNSH
ncbi:MAG TPA: cation:proton antiporter [Candidatus Obscuribacterales bacterium]